MLTEREIPHNARPGLQTLYRYVKTIILQGYLKDGNMFASIRDSLQPSLDGKEVILLKARFLILVQGLYKSDMRDNEHDVLSQNFVPSSHKQTHTYTNIFVSMSDAKGNKMAKCRAFPNTDTGKSS
jgi:hypothetical protein